MDVDKDQLIEEMGLLFEKSGASKTFGRIFAYLLLAEKPKTLDEIAEDLLFSKATASLTLRQGLLIQFFEKVSLPGERKTFFKVNTESWIRATSAKMKALHEWDRLISKGLSIVPADNREATEKLQAMKDYFDFIAWYFSDINEYYERWKKGEIKPHTKQT
ncbi:MAG: GbsR/MarR family transcriptional regulator [Bacillota bacterium]|nr:hypothetical protein [Bacillota bacterium]